MVWIKLFFLHVFIFAVFCYYFFFPLRIEISKALRAEKQLSQELLKQQKSYIKNQNYYEKLYFNYYTEDALIKYFINKIITSKFLIEEIYPTKIRKHKNLIVVSFKLTFSGGFFQLKNIIDLLSKDQVLINIDEVVVKKSSNKIVMKIDVFNINDVETKVFLKHFYVLQWIGYTENNHTIKGLLRLENGSVLEVEAGSVINKTLKVLKITKDEMLIQMDNRKSMIKYGQLLEI